MSALPQEWYLALSQEQYPALSQERCPALSQERYPALSQERYLVSALSQESEVRPWGSALGLGDSPLPLSHSPDSVPLP